MCEYSPMMKRYLETKEQYKDCILFYRLGDFYEMFFEDAKIVSKELDLVLTGKNCGLKERAPMCGIPFHAVDSYLGRLVKAGHKVAICEQLEDPKTAKGIVKRDVVRIVTPGTNIDTAALSEDKNNYLCAAMQINGQIGLAFADVSTGDFFATQVETVSAMADEVRKFSPTEIITNEALQLAVAAEENTLLSLTMQGEELPVTVIEETELEPSAMKRAILEQYAVSDLSVLGLEAMDAATTAAGATIVYLHETQRQELSHMRLITVYTDTSYMLLDLSTRRNLELSETMRDKGKRGSLFWVLDRTKTAMGARLLRSSIEQPLVDVEKIRERADAVEELFEDNLLREELREALSHVYDLERLLTRISYRNANPRDLLAFKQSIGVLKEVKALLNETESKGLSGIFAQIDPMMDLFLLIDESIQEDPPVSVHDGGIIRTGFLEEVDTLRAAQTDGKKWLADLESKEREKTGIKNLRIKYNKVFGYYLEVTNSYKELVPDYFIRKQTLTNAERFFTPELKELENTIMGAQDRLVHLEYDLYQNILAQIVEQIPRVQTQAKLLANLDMLQSLAQVARKNHYVRPEVTTQDTIDIVRGRHPVIEQMISDGQFVPNDTHLDAEDTRLSIITGPNMAGKSTYMRQTALIVLLAQIGSFVPAEKATIGIVDRIFTRVGASDDLASGQSTFMVEMNEVANILLHATKHSLLILDEIGRGTSTFDGLAIAWAVVERIADPDILGAKTLFATHYHELTELEGKLDGVKNFCIAVREQGEEIVFLRKIIPGGADKSYGIQVAKLAGVPDSVIQRAGEIVEDLIANDVAGVIKEAASGEQCVENHQISLFDRVLPVDERQKAKDAIYNELLVLDLNTTTPMEALMKLHELQQKAKEW
ncbi:MAG: DNA mismatch repair protein MutS [Lachnospiraceae bacterium]|nr:DNA mismatch repair protein MutS [Lachnospiraceae bacterium]